MKEMNTEELEDTINFLFDKKEVRREAARTCLVDYVGWGPKTPEGQLLGHYIVREAKAVRKKKRKSEGESYVQHCIRACRRVSKSPVYDLPLAIAIIGHDGPEEVRDYEKAKINFEKAKNYSEKRRIAEKADKIRESYLAKTQAFLEEKARELSVPLNIEEAIRLEDGLTKRPYEHYYQYLARIGGRAPDEEYAKFLASIRESPPKYSLQDILKMLVIKTGGDRADNNSTAPLKTKPKQETGFTVPQRSKECFKSIQVIDRIVNFTIDQPEAKELFPEYLEFLIESKKRLIDIGSKIESDDVDYLTKILSVKIGKEKLNFFDKLFDNYDELRVMPPATYEEILADPRKIYNGTLARFDVWGKEIHKWGLTEPQQIKLPPSHIKYMIEVHEITDPDMRSRLQERMDCKVLSLVLEKYKVDSSYRLEGWGDVNKQDGNR